jgi:hypothetical protein
MTSHFESAQRIIFSAAAAALFSAVLLTAAVPVFPIA